MAGEMVAYRACVSTAVLQGPPGVVAHLLEAGVEPVGDSAINCPPTLTSLATSVASVVSSGRRTRSPEKPWSSATSARNRPIAHTPGSLPAGSEPAPRCSPWRVAANEAAVSLSAGSEPAPRSGGRFRRRLQPHAGDREEPDGSARPQPRTP